MAGLDYKADLVFHPDGNDGGTDVIESGNTGHVATRVGDASFSEITKAFGTTSLLLGGSSDYLSIPNSSDFDIMASNAVSNVFTVEAWVYAHDISASRPIFQHYNSAASYSWWLLEHTTAGLKLSFRLTGTTYINYDTNVKIDVNRWEHVVLYVEGTGSTKDIGIYLNGRQVGWVQHAQTGTVGGPLYIGYNGEATTEWDGHLDEARIYAGNPYSANPNSGKTDLITVPTAAHTSDVNTNLLLHMEGMDRSQNHANATFQGTAQVDTAVSKFGDGSLLLDGNSDYVEIPDSEAWNFGDDDWTIDAWIYFNNVTQNDQYVCSQSVDSQNYWGLYWDNSNQMRMQMDNNAGDGDEFFLGASFTPTINTWYHLAVVREGNDFTMYINGTSIGSTTDASSTFPSLAHTLEIGARTSSSKYFFGQIEEFRISNFARWTANFTAPTDYYSTPDSGGITSDTTMLVRGDGPDGSYEISDSGAGHVVTQNGTAALSTTQKKFGSSSLYLPGTSANYLTVPDSADWDLFASNSDSWTMDLWMKPDDYTASEDQILLQQYQDNNTRWHFWYHCGTGGGRGFRCYFVSGGLDYGMTSINTPLSDNNWHHIAVCKVADEYGLYVDGTQVNYAQTSTTVNMSGLLYIGADNAGTSNFHGYLDEIRITKSNPFQAAPVVGLTDTITVPASAYEDINARLLLHMEPKDVSLNYNIPDFGGTAASLSTNVQWGWGRSSLWFDGNSDYIKIPDAGTDFDIVASSSDNWTIDLWARWNSHGSGGDIMTLYSQFQSAINYIQIKHRNSSGLRWEVQVGGGVIIDTGYVAEITDTGIWHHIAMCKVGSLYGLYIDGAQVGYTNDSSTGNLTGDVYLGQRGDSGNWFNGEMNEIRVQHSNWFGAAPVVGLTDTIDVPLGQYTEEVLSWTGYSQGIIIA